MDTLYSRVLLWSKTHHTSPEKVSQHYSRQFQKVAFQPYLELAQPYKQLGRILDFGCGIGGFVDAAQYAGWDSYGIDISPSIDIARERGLKVFQGQLEDLNLPPHFFDVITLFDVVEHILDLNKLLVEIKQFLRPGGVMIIATPNFYSLTSRLLGEKWVSVEPEDHIILFSPSTITSFLRKHSFEPVRISTLDIDLLGLKYAFSPHSTVEERRKRQKENRLLIASIIRSPFIIKTRYIANWFLDRTKLGERLIVLAKLPG